jgi:hypothetical protein
MKALEKWEEKNQNWRWRTEEMKKWTEGADVVIYKAVLPTDSPMDIKKYYFNFVRRWRFKNPSVIFEFRTNIFNYPQYFSLSVGNSIGKLTRSEMHLMHRPLEFAQSVGDLVGNIISRQMTDDRYSVGKFIGDYGISSDYFRTLCQMPTDLIPSVIVVFQVIIFELSVKCRRILFHRYGRR